jgi:type III secretory pathway component EscU
MLAKSWWSMMFLPMCLSLPNHFFERYLTSERKLAEFVKIFVKEGRIDEKWKTRNARGTEARGPQNKGQVSKSSEVNSTALRRVLCAYVEVGWKHHIKAIGDMLVFPIDYLSIDFGMASANVLVGIFQQAFAIILPAFGICMLMTVISNCSQIGFLLTFETRKRRQ